jgi:hypothetical protein
MSRPRKVPPGTPSTCFPNHATFFCRLATFYNLLTVLKQISANSNSGICNVPVTNHSELRFRLRSLLRSLEFGPVRLEEKFR